MATTAAGASQVRLLSLLAFGVAVRELVGPCCLHSPGRDRMVGPPGCFPVGVCIGWGCQQAGVAVG
eukprot:140666-Alexandrium_andersonii.AAC.1